MLLWLLLAALVGLHSTRVHRPIKTLVVTTANIHSTLPRGPALRAIEIALRGSHLVGVQEMHGRDAASFVDRREWGTVQKKGMGAGRCAIYYRRDRLRLLRWQSAVLNRAGGFTFPAARRQFVWAVFRDLETGRWVTFASVHFVPHADDPDGSITHMPRQVLVNEAIATLCRFAHAVGRGAVVIVGDFNVNAARDVHHHDKADLIEQMHRAGLISVAARFPDADPTHGAHDQYDQGFVRLPDGWSLGNDWTREDGPGDHLAYSFPLHATTRVGWPKA